MDLVQTTKEGNYYHMMILGQFSSMSCTDNPECIALCILKNNIELETYTQLLPLATFHHSLYTSHDHLI